MFPRTSSSSSLSSGGSPSLPSSSGHSGSGSRSRFSASTVSSSFATPTSGSGTRRTSATDREGSGTISSYSARSGSGNGSGSGSGSGTGARSWPRERQGRRQQPQHQPKHQPKHQRRQRGHRGGGSGEEDEFDDSSDEEWQGGNMNLRGGPSSSVGSGRGGEEAVVMAVARKGPKLGFACYDDLKSTIYIAELLASVDMRETVQAVKLHLQPTAFLIDPHLLADEDFCKLLACAVSEDRREYPLKIAKTRNWDHAHAITTACSSLRVRALEEAGRSADEERELAQEDERMMRGLISASALSPMGGGLGAGMGGAEMMAEEVLDKRRNFDRLSAVLDLKGGEPLAVRALGALLLHLQTTTFQLEPGGLVAVQTMERFDLNRYVRLDSNAFFSLQIFHEERHPNVISGKGRSKEGFSLYALLDQTHSQPGRACLREWMLRPLRQPEAIVRRQRVIDLLMQSEASEAIANLCRFLPKIAIIGRALLRLRRSACTYKDWIIIANTTQHALLVQNCLVVLQHLAARIRPEATEGIQSLCQRVSRDALCGVGEALAHVLDVELTRETKALAVRLGCDDELDRLREQWDQLEDFLSDEARRLLEEQQQAAPSSPGGSHRWGSRYEEKDDDGRSSTGGSGATPARALLSEVSVQFLPQIGYLAVVSADERVAIEGDPAFRFVFAQGAHFFYKTPRMEELDDDLGDIQAAIKDREDALLRALAERVLEEEIPLTEAVRVCAELDCLLSLASIANGLHWVCPQITHERVIIIKDGRHPLAELAVDTFIPNDTCLTRDNSLAVITGPNFSGKSIYVKQCAVLVYLGMLGSFIPCTQALIGVVDGIYVRIASNETVSVQQSTFTLDLSQMNTIFRQATEDSLVVVDEFGKGSAETDGIGLLVASMAQLRRLGARALVTTHFLEIFHEGLIPREIADQICFRMDVYVPHAQLPQPAQAVGADGQAPPRPPQANTIQTIVPLFKLTKGVASSSDGFSCAVLAGLATPVVQRAEYIAQCHLEGALPIPPLCAPLIRLPEDRERAHEAEREKEEEEDDGEEDDGVGHRGRRSTAAAAAAARKKKKPSKLNVIPFNEQAQRVLTAFLHVTGAEGGGMEEGEEDEEQVRELLALLKTT